MAKTSDMQIGTVRPDGSAVVQTVRVKTLRKNERIGVTQIHDLKAIFVEAPKCVVGVPQDIVDEISGDTKEQRQHDYDVAVYGIGRTPSVVLRNMDVAPARTYKPKVITTILPLPKPMGRIKRWYFFAKDYLPCSVCGGMTRVRLLLDRIFTGNTPVEDGCHIRCGNGYAIRTARDEPNRHERARRKLSKPPTPKWVQEMLA